MAYGVQLGAKYVLIGGPRETGSGRTNLISNPSLEDGTLLPWEAGISSGGTLNNFEAHSATWSADEAEDRWSGHMKWTNAADTTPRDAEALSSNAIGAQDTIPVVAGLTYSARVRVKVTAGAAGVPFKMRQRWYTAAGAQVGSGALSNQTTNNQTGVFEFIIENQIAPATAVGMVLRIGATGMATASDVIEFWWDAALVVQAASLPDHYFDGNTPGYYWTDPTLPTSASAQDGTRAVLNDDTDPDFVGYATDVTGLEGAEVRESFVDNIEADGALHGEFYQGRRPITITAAIGGNVTPATRNARQQRWLAASRALRNYGKGNRPGVLRWQPDGAIMPMYTKIRRQQPPRVTGLVMKEVPIALVAEDPRIYGLDKIWARFTLTGSGVAGRTYDRSYNVNFGWATARGSFTVTNTGDADTPVIIIIEDAVSTFALQNLTTEEEIALNGSIVAGQRITIDTLRKTVTLDDGTNLFDRVELARTRWWGLAPGPNVLKPLAETFSGTDITVMAHPAWA